MDCAKTATSGFIAIALLSLMLSTTASSEPRDWRWRFGTGEVTEAISAKDLDLTKPEDARELYRRIVFAAKRICWNSSPTSDLQLPARARAVADQRFNKCVDDAVTRVTKATGRDVEVIAGLERVDEAGLAASSPRSSTR